MSSNMFALLGDDEENEDPGKILAAAPAEKPSGAGREQGKVAAGRGRGAWNGWLLELRLEQCGR
jgi:hypothetical protein